MFYTAQSGIWQTVWLERVPEKYIKEVETIPEPDEKKVRIIVRSDAEYAVKIVLQKPKIHKELEKNVPDNPVEGMIGSEIYGKTNEWLEIRFRMCSCGRVIHHIFMILLLKWRKTG